MTAQTKYLEPIASEEVIELIQTADSIPTGNFAIASVPPAPEIARQCARGAGRSTRHGSGA